MPKLVVVAGATGGQGGSVVSSFLKDDNYRVRGITRKPQSGKSQVLVRQGVEMVQADLNNFDSLVNAFKDAAIIFAVTNFFEPLMGEDGDLAMEFEYSHAYNMALAASVTTSLEHYIWSTLPSAREISKGEYAIRNFESTSRIDNAIKESLPALYAKTTFLWCSYYASNIQLPMSSPSYHKALGKYIWLQPVARGCSFVCLGSHTSNIGVFVLSIVKQPQLTLPGRYVLAHYETLTAGEILDIWSEVTGKEAVYVEIQLDDYVRLWPKGGQEMGYMLRFWEEMSGLSWSKEGLVTGKDLLAREHLGIKKSDLVGVREAFERLDWSKI